MEKLILEIMNLIEKEIPLLEKEAKEWAKKSKELEYIYEIYKLASEAREL